MTNDFKYAPYTNSSHPDIKLWKITCGKQITTICRSEEYAIELVEKLNVDKYFLLRGQTQKDRAKSFAFR
jgi:hypothetical protein